MNFWANGAAHPGWPYSVGPLRVGAGVVRLRPVRVRDAAQWSRARLAQRRYLEQWEPSGELDWSVRHAISAWPTMYAGLRGEARRGRMLPYAIEVDGQFQGQLTIGNVTHGSLKSAWIGYWVSSEITGKGVATAALALGVDHCFGPVSLHRVEATVRPENVASRSVLSKVGFREEGLLERYLHVDGAWRDHLLMAVTGEEIQTSAAARLVERGLADWM